MLVKRWLTATSGDCGTVGEVRLRFAPFFSIFSTASPRAFADHQFSKPEAANRAQPAGGESAALPHSVLANSSRVQWLSARSSQ